MLFDLDGTLLINDMESFGPHYFKALLTKFRRLCPRTTGYLGPDQLFASALQIATRAMWLNDGSSGTNADVFWAEFFPRIGREPEELMPLFEEFYAHDFESLRKHTSRDPDAHPLVSLAFGRGYQVAIATQPMFPMAANLARLRWAGVSAEEFHYDYIASYETMTACKPHPRFFAELLERLGRVPQECLMVGDSLEADMPAGQLGLRTFWVNRWQRDEPPLPAYDAHGTLRDLIELIETGRMDAPELRGMDAPELRGTGAL